MIFLLFIVECKKLRNKLNSKTGCFIKFMPCDVTEDCCSGLKCRQFYEHKKNRYINLCK